MDFRRLSIARNCDGLIRWEAAESAAEICGKSQRIWFVEVVSKSLGEVQDNCQRYSMMLYGPASQVSYIGDYIGDGKQIVDEVDE